VSIDTSKSLYFHIPDSDVPILHVGQTAHSPDPKKFQRLAHLDANRHTEFSSGSFDHCYLAVDAQDYDAFMARLKQHDIAYQPLEHTDLLLKQAWVLDPSGVRVELSCV
jgi:hypothetical protein